MAAIDASMFKKFVELHLLQLDGTPIESDFSGTSDKLWWLQWRSSFLEYVPTKMCLSCLTMLDLFKSNTLTRLWSENQVKLFSTRHFNIIWKMCLTCVPLLYYLILLFL